MVLDFTQRRQNARLFEERARRLAEFEGGSLQYWGWYGVAIIAGGLATLAAIAAIPVIAGILIGKYLL